jgi:hypothetical protein
MKLFEKFVENALEKTKLLETVINTVKTLAAETHRLGVTMVSLAQTIHMHQRAIQDLYARQGLVLQTVKDNSLDLKLPNSDDDEESSKPN